MANEIYMENIMIANINTALNSEFILDILKKAWIQTYSIRTIGKIIGEIYTYIIIHKDGYDFENYITKMALLYILYEADKQTRKLEFASLEAKERLEKERKMYVELQERLKKEKAILLIYSIAKRLGMNEKELSRADEELVKEYFLKEYVTNGYVSHSFPEAYKNSILTKGLISCASNRNIDDSSINEIHQIFVRKGILTPIGWYPYYNGDGIYFEHDHKKIFQHATNSPEWFNWFTSSNHSHAFLRLPQTPYVLRNKEACARNVLDLCQNANLNDAETGTVMKFFEENYQRFALANLNVALIPKRIIGKNEISKAVPSNLGLLETIIFVLDDKFSQYIEHQGNTLYQDIPPQHFKLTSLPEANKFMKVLEYKRESPEELTDERTKEILQTRINATKSAKQKN